MRHLVFEKHYDRISLLRSSKQSTLTPVKFAATDRWCRFSKSATHSSPQQKIYALMMVKAVGWGKE
jgi:hypothetical protein